MSEAPGRTESERTLLAGLAREVRRLRKQAGLTRGALCERTAVSERFLAEIEAGRANPSLLVLHELARALSAPLPALLGTLDEAGHHRVIALLGLRGAGKSSVGKKLAHALRRPFVELDARVAKASGLTLAEIFELHGERFYREREREALLAVLREAEKGPLVLATGGGVVSSEETYDLLRSRAHTVWLQATPQEHWRRVIAQGDTRPMAKNAKSYQQLCQILAERERLYRRAELTVTTTGKTVAAIGRELAERFAFLRG